MKAEAGSIVLTLTHDEAVRLRSVAFGAMQTCAWGGVYQPELKALHDALAVALGDRKAP